MKSYLDMTDDEIESRAALTAEEKSAVDSFISAAKQLPKSICIAVRDDGDNEPNLTVSKRITPGSAQQVASLRKKSLKF